ncbi:TPA: replication initiator protein A [Enterococcus faecalis]|nr:replication initiator protein A [Enterococcus faecalis]HDM0540821.1 replication initiator protein A [Staphylococcus aureus]MBJ0372702.1 replication initiator protein A [Enterococcus faecalis]MBJ0423202.1 replication initiator protein A [Enterococcus faecalis]MBJ1788512.1 replication initiator protein A [Enterococcus faecalis]MBS6900024.1 replication initiator protein A [Enterococcus faecalis]
MSSFNYISSERVYNELYYQFPKVFIESDTYSNLSDGAKIAYMLLKSRLEFAIMQDWKDENGYIFFQFTNIELQKMLNCGSQKVSHIKKELEEFNLLKQRRMGFNKKEGKNYPNRLYLAGLEVTENDIYKMKKREQSLDTSGHVKITSSKSTNETSQSLDTSGHVKITSSKKRPESLDTSGHVKIKQVFNNTNKDTYKDTVIDTTKEELQHRELLQSFSETQDQTFLDKHCLELIALFSNTIQEAYNAVGIIIRAKNKQEKKYGRVLIAEDWQEEIETTLRKVYHKIKTDAKIKNVDNYMFGAFCTTFENCLLQLQSWEQKNDSQTVVTLHDWLEGND